MTARSTGVRIFWISLIGLYLELLLIRWVGTEIKIFAYLQNTILVVCFLGLGIGLFSARRPASPNLGLAALAVLAGALAWQPSRLTLQATSVFLDLAGEVNIWGRSGVESAQTMIVGTSLGLLLAFVVMLAVMLPFIPVGRVLGRLLDDHPRPIVAYSLNVAGSLAGIWLFVGLSRWNQPPAVWFAVLCAVCLPYLARRRAPNWLGMALLFSLLPISVVAQKSSGATQTIWSPYQKLELFDTARESRGFGPTTKYVVYVNNTGYQSLLDLSTYGGPAGPAGRDAALSPYDVPALLHATPGRVLVVGSGTGNDVAGMLRSGAGQVTAVDIDPAILSLGRRYHPERPYDSPRVEMVNTDARSFFATADGAYDVVAFGLLDAHTTTSLTNARLDHYVYTAESFERVKGLLASGGLVCVLFDPLRPFIIDRIAVELRDVFGHEPLVFGFPVSDAGPRGVLLVAGDLESARARIETVPELQPLRSLELGPEAEPSYTTRPATDDWPYLYLDGPRIPNLFVFLAGLLGLLVLLAWRIMDLPAATNPRRWGREGWHFFFLGAAFLLLEVQNISKASVVLGNTWLVNAVIISGVLGMVLLANALVIRWRRIPLAPVYAVLLAIVAGLYFVDLARFAFLPFALKAGVVGSLTTLPMAFSGIAFARAFELAGRKDHALGANLVGALVGAVLESLSFLLGIRALLLLVAVFYAAAMVTRPDAAPAVSPATVPESA